MIEECPGIPGKDFQCICGDQYFQNVENYQQTCDESLLESLNPSQVIDHQKDTDQRLCSRIVKLHDIVSNCQKDAGNQVVNCVKRVIQAMLEVQAKQKTASPFLVSVISSAFTNYRNHYQDLLNSEYFEKLPSLPIPIGEMTVFGREAFFQSLLKYCQNGQEIEKILQNSQLNDSLLKEMAPRLLFRVSGGLDHWSMYSSFVCYLSKSVQESTFLELFKQALTLWSDPVIAKAYIYGEVIHYTKLCLLFFTHCSPGLALKVQDNIIKFVAQGLPNHFSSSDHRSIQLAKYFCEILTESLKLYEKRSESIPTTLSGPEEFINQQLLQSCHKCPTAMHFWTNFHLEKMKKGSQEDHQKSTKLPNVIQSDEEDDDDLEPIETLEAPIKMNVAYIRDFIETLSEDKPYDERLATFQTLPNIVKHQMKHEHPQVGVDLLNKLVYWENDFDCAQMEVHRKRSLCNALTAKMETNVRHLASMFPREVTRVPQQILIVDVLSTAASEASLANLQILAKAAFEEILQVDIFESRQVPVRIPLILFFHRLLCTMPVPMIRSEMINAYLRALTYMTNIDKTTEQTISYSLHHLMDKFRDIQFANDEAQNQDLSARLAEMRAWMWNLHHQNPISAIQDSSNAL